MFETSRRPITREHLLGYLTDQILDGKIKGGEKIPSERELATQSGLSRPVVREVLRALQARGLIATQPGRGAFVMPADSVNVAGSLDILARGASATPQDLIEARAGLEENNARLAAARITDEELKNLEALSRAFDQADNVIDRARCDLAFHGVLARASHNPVLETMFRAIIPLVFVQQLRSLDDPKILASGAPLHGVVVEALRHGDAEAAGTAARQHVELASEMFGEDLERSLDSIARRKVASLLGESIQLDDVIRDVLRDVPLQ